MKKCLNKHLLFLLALLVLSLSIAYFFHPQSVVGDSRLQISAEIDEFTTLTHKMTKAGHRINTSTNSKDGLTLIINGSIYYKNLSGDTIFHDYALLLGVREQHQLLLVPQY